MPNHLIRSCTIPKTVTRLRGDVVSAYVASQLRVYLCMAMCLLATRLLSTWLCLYANLTAC